MTIFYVTLARFGNVELRLSCSMFGLAIMMDTDRVEILIGPFELKVPLSWKEKTK